MRGREFILLLGVVAGLASPAAADARKPKIGFLDWFPESMKADLDRFREGMRQYGYIAGENYEVEAYFTAENLERTQEIAHKLATEPVDIIVANATPAVHIVKAATNTVPVVFGCANALATGLVPSLSHPGGNLTGVSLLLTDLAGKRLEFLRDIRPGLERVAFLASTKDPNAATFVHQTQAAADRLHVALSVHWVDAPHAIDQATFDAMNLEGSQAVIVQPIFTGYQDKIVPMATRDRLPVVADFAAFADAGALLTYGARLTYASQRLAYYVDRILKGAKPGDLPVEQPTEFELVINLKTAKALGLTVPRPLLSRADRVIE
jgi:putative tryptophan/tyrosine transport system substrate-binding protein